MPFFTLKDRDGPKGWYQLKEDGRVVGWSHMRTVRPDPRKGGEASVEACFSPGMCRETNYRPGEFHPRISRRGPVWHQHVFPNMTDIHQEAFESSCSAARPLFVRLEDPVFRTIEPDSRNFATFGHELRHLLVLAATEVESGLKAVLKANFIDPMPTKTGKRRDGYNVGDFLRLVRPMRLDGWQVRLAGHERFPPLTPFVGASPTSPPEWWTAYNRVKHDRETELHRATLKNVLDALAAVVVVINAQFGPHSFTPVGMYIPPHVGPPNWDPEEFYVPPFFPEGHSAWTPVPLRL